MKVILLVLVIKLCLFQYISVSTYQNSLRDSSSGYCAAQTDGTTLNEILFLKNDNCYKASSAVKFEKQVINIPQNRIDITSNCTNSSCIECEASSQFPTACTLGNQNSSTIVTSVAKPTKPGAHPDGVFFIHYSYGHKMCDPTKIFKVSFKPKRDCEGVGCEKWHCDNDGIVHKVTTIDIKYSGCYSNIRYCCDWETDCQLAGSFSLNFSFIVLAIILIIQFM